MIGISGQTCCWLKLVRSSSFRSLYLLAHPLRLEPRSGQLRVGLLDTTHISSAGESLKVAKHLHVLRSLMIIVDRLLRLVCMTGREPRSHCQAQIGAMPKLPGYLESLLLDWPCLLLWLASLCSRNGSATPLTGIQAPCVFSHTLISDNPLS